MVRGMSSVNQTGVSCWNCLVGVASVAGIMISLRAAVRARIPGLCGHPFGFPQACEQRLEGFSSRENFGDKKQSNLTPAKKFPALEVPVYPGVKVPPALRNSVRSRVLSRGATSTESSPALPVPGISSPGSGYGLRSICFISVTLPAFARASSSEISPAFTYLIRHWFIVCIPQKLPSAMDP